MSKRILEVNHEEVALKLLKVMPPRVDPARSSLSFDELPFSRSLLNIHNFTDVISSEQLDLPSSIRNTLDHFAFLYKDYKCRYIIIKTIEAIKQGLINAQHIGYNLAICAKFSDDATLINQVIDAIKEQKIKINSLAACLYCLAKDVGNERQIKQFIDNTLDQSKKEKVISISLYYLFQEVDGDSIINTLFDVIKDHRLIVKTINMSLSWLFKDDDVVISSDLLEDKEEKAFLEHNVLKQDDVVGVDIIGDQS